jgi:hypothetical protein
MSTEKLKYLSEKVANDLRDNVKTNVTRYQNGNFTDLVDDGGWSIELNLDVDLGLLKELEGDKGTEAEVKNSLLVWKTLSHMTPSLARENRIWTRLTHVECLAYARARWLKNISAEDLEDSVIAHFFADTQTRCRDDNAVGRLWWNVYIANSAMPSDLEGALKAMLKTADIRSNVVERPWVTSRPKIAAGILRAIIRNPIITETEAAFRTFMKTVNRRGGGMLFELMDDIELNSFMDECSA